MSRMLLVLLVCATAAPGVRAQEVDRQNQAADSQDKTAIRKHLESYLEAFNRHDAAAVGKFWSIDCVSLAEDSGERISGREALVRHFTTFFEENTTARLIGEITEIKVVRPEVALIEGRTTLVVGDAKPVVSTFSSLLLKDGGEWLISNSRERDVPPKTSRVALKELEWLIGTWQDQSDEVQVSTTVRWSHQEAFLIRSFVVQYPGEEPQEGTQVIGWDPLNQNIRTWTFDSDGSFGQGTISRHDDEWLLKFWQVRSDGQLAAATQVISRIDDDTMTVQVIGETLDGEPSPSSTPVTVMRVKPAEDLSKDGTTAKPGEAR